MPEGAEVETIRRAILPVLSGRTLERVTVGHPKMLRNQPGGQNGDRGTDFMRRVAGHTVADVVRWGKYMGIVLDDGQSVVLMHLGMSGWLYLCNEADPVAKHTHLTLGWLAGTGGSGGSGAGAGEHTELRFVDPRRFGWFGVFSADETEGIISKLGPDGLRGEMTGEMLYTRLATRRAAIKTILGNQHIVSGLGNIYTDEVLHAAKVHPASRANAIPRERVDVLAAAIQPTLRAGVQAGGTTLGDGGYRGPDGESGRGVHILKVHVREGLDCMTCGTTIQRSTIGGRSSYWCGTCQQLYT